MKMTPLMLILGGLLVYWASVAAMLFVPMIMMEDMPSEIWRPWTAQESAGHDLYVRNGCSYCHSLFIRANDWGHGAVRIAKAGDYYQQQPAILGTERTGPDLSQEGGLRPDDWHTAHFVNPRNTSPLSIMPAWEFLGMDKIRALTAFMQSQGLLMADDRMNRQTYWKEQAVAANKLGPDSNIEWLHSQIPPGWRMLPNPYPASDDAVERGTVIYEEFCVNCHGPMGAGDGPAAPFLDPRPLNFTTLRRHLVEGRYIGGILYYQVMNGITGSA
ncbi:MAG: cbb3-type cytochrome c oxidase subunit II, partial [Candidatus Hydrogenedentes bacterium]|nr:cbb3-type cytochrome c oxidase subunit II [Candidatus Hydrogenedentota bacterium]